MDIEVERLITAYTTTTLSGSIPVYDDDLLRQCGEHIEASYLNEPLDMTFRRLQCRFVEEQRPLLDLMALLDFSLFCQQQNLLDETVPFLLIEEVCDGLTLDACDQIFAYIERRLPLLRQHLLPQRGKGLILLRLCNDLLRRLSKTQHPIFCGRILMLLSSVFPLADRSGVNLRGDYNIENETWFEGKQQVLDSDLVKETAALKAITFNLHHVQSMDPHFYRVFWSLQRFFSQPNLLVQQASNFFYFQQALDKVLVVVQEAQQLEKQFKSKVEQSPSRSTASSSFFFAKYLTRPNLLRLQLMDPHFRRTLLTQIMIVLVHLLHTSRQQAALVKDPKEKDSFQLSQQESWLVACRQLVLQLIDPTPQTNTRTYLQVVQRILYQERNWVDWKAGSCPALDLPPDDQLRAFEPDRPYKRPCFQPAWELGHPELARLWSHPGPGRDQDEEDSEAEEDRWLDVFKDDEMRADAMERLKEDVVCLRQRETYSWRTWRMMARKDHDLLLQVSTTQSNLSSPMATSPTPESALLHHTEAEKEMKPGNTEKTDTDMKPENDMTEEKQENGVNADQTNVHEMDTDSQPANETN